MGFTPTPKNSAEKAPGYNNQNSKKTKKYDYSPMVWGFTLTPRNIVNKVQSYYNQYFKKVKKSSHESMVWGFTLIELLVVIAIIGVLAAYISASLNNARTRSRDARRLSDIKQIQNALTLYADSNSALYPADIYAAGVLAPTHIPAVPKDPQGANYSYELCTGNPVNSGSYHLGTSLEDGGNQALNSAAGVATPAGCSATWNIRTAGACTGTSGTQQGSNCYDVTP